VQSGPRGGNFIGLLGCWASHSLSVQFPSPHRAYSAFGCASEGAGYYSPNVPAKSRYALLRRENIVVRSPSPNVEMTIFLLGQIPKARVTEGEKEEADFLLLGEMELGPSTLPSSLSSTQEKPGGRSFTATRQFYPILHSHCWHITCVFPLGEKVDTIWHDYPHSFAERDGRSVSKDHIILANVVRDQRKDSIGSDEKESQQRDSVFPFAKILPCLIIVGGIFLFLWNARGWHPGIFHDRLWPCFLYGWVLLFVFLVLPPPRSLGKCPKGR
jgi:hypothetical protein